MAGTNDELLVYRESMCGEERGRDKERRQRNEGERVGGKERAKEVRKEQKMEMMDNKESVREL